jgi:hypothetical protein
VKVKAREAGQSHTAQRKETALSVFDLGREARVRSSGDEER